MNPPPGLSKPYSDRERLLHLCSATWLPESSRRAQASVVPACYLAMPEWTDDTNVHGPEQLLHITSMTVMTA